MSRVSKRVRSVAPAVSLLAFASELVHYVTQYLDVYSVMAMKDSCRQMHNVCQPGGHAWHTVDIIRTKEPLYSEDQNGYPRQYFHWFTHAHRAWSDTNNLIALSLGMPNLRFLHLHDVFLRDVEPLVDLTSLQTLELVDVDLIDQGVSLMHLQSLTSLTLDAVSADLHPAFPPLQFLVWMNKLPNLKRLHIYLCRISKDEEARFNAQVKDTDYEDLVVEFLSDADL